MKALILNSGLGSRMGDITKFHPKCMTEIEDGETILSRQLKQLVAIGCTDVVMTTGIFDELIQNYCSSLNLPINIKFVLNPVANETNYIYSIYCAKEFLDDDIILMHGDLVFDDDVLKDIYKYKYSCMAVSSSLALPEKDFKAVIKEDHISEIGVNSFTNAVAAQPLYKIFKNDWNLWLDKIAEYCEGGNVKCYAENAFNDISSKCIIMPFDVKDRLCSEIDTAEDLDKIKNILNDHRIGDINNDKTRR